MRSYNSPEDRLYATKCGFRSFGTVQERYLRLNVHESELFSADQESADSSFLAHARAFPPVRAASGGQLVPRPAEEPAGPPRKVKIIEKMERVAKPLGCRMEVPFINRTSRSRPDS